MRPRPRRSGSFPPPPTIAAQARAGRRRAQFARPGKDGPEISAPIACQLVGLDNPLTRCRRLTTDPLAQNQAPEAGRPFAGGLFRLVVTDPEREISLCGSCWYRFCSFARRGVANLASPRHRAGRQGVRCRLLRRPTDRYRRRDEQCSKLSTTCLLQSLP